MEPAFTAAMDTGGGESHLQTEAKSTEPVVRPLKWKSVLFPAGKPSKPFKLRFIPPDPRDDSNVGICSKEAVRGELEILDLTLVGFFLGKRPAYSFVKAALLRQWKLRGNVEIIQLLHGGFAFRFSDVRDRDDILDGEAFYIGGQPMFIRKWERHLHSGGILGLKSVPLWITLPGLPLHLWGEESLSAICSVLGNPLYADRTTATKSRLAFARVCVEFSGDKPLLEIVTIQDDMGLMFSQKVGYEWKPPQCLKCGVFGHADCGISEEGIVPPSQKSGQIPQHPIDMEQSGSINGKGEDISKDKLIFLEKEKHSAEEEGWEYVRARKRRPTGSGNPYPVQTRPDKRNDRLAGEEMARPYWTKKKIPFEKVCISEPSLNKEILLKDNSCSEKEVCSNSVTDLLVKRGEIPGQKRDMLNAEKEADVLTPNWRKQNLLTEKEKKTLNSDLEETNPIIEEVEKESMTVADLEPSNSEIRPGMLNPHWWNQNPKEDKIPNAVDYPDGQSITRFENEPFKEHLSNSTPYKEHNTGPSHDSNRSHQEPDSTNGKMTQSYAAQKSGPIKPGFSFGSKPVSLGSTAGHTPFKSRLASMARDLRNRNLGQQSLLENSGGIPSYNDEICSPHSHNSCVGSIGSTNVPIQKNYNSLIGRRIQPKRKDEKESHMEMPKYLMTRKMPTEQNHLNQVLEKEQQRVEFEDNGQEHSINSVTRGEEMGSEQMGHEQVHSPN